MVKVKIFNQKPYTQRRVDHSVRVNIKIFLFAVSE